MVACNLANQHSTNSGVVILFSLSPLSILPLISIYNILADASACVRSRVFKDLTTALFRL